jgi:4-hydroxy-tetrahydrodipicolinate synthase
MTNSAPSLQAEDQLGEDARVARLPRGIVASSVTPADPDGAINVELIGAHIDWLIDEGVDGISPLGSSGEFVALSRDERQQVLEAAIAAVDGRVHVMAGTHHYATRETVELSKLAERAGADSLLIVPPYYMSPSPAQVMDHYRRVAETVDIPIVLYHNAAGTRIDLSTEQLATLVDEGVIAGVKMSNPEADRIRQLLDATDGNCRVYAGLDTVAFEGLCHGAHGWISGIPSVIPRHARALYTTIAEDADLVKGRELWRALAPLMRLQFQAYLGRGGGPQWLAVAKGVLNFIGPPVGDPIPPIQPIAGEDAARLASILTELGYTLH